MCVLSFLYECVIIIVLRYIEFVVTIQRAIEK